MDLGAVIRAERRRRGWTQPELARRTGLSASTIKSHELGKRVPRADTLRRYAAAFDVDDAELQRRALQAGGSVPANAAPESVSIEVSDQQVERQLQERSPEYWIALGDVAAFRSDFVTALERYEQAARLIPRRDYSWARLTLERIGQMLINLDAFERLGQTIDQIEHEYQRPFRERFGQDDPTIRMLIEEKKTWRETWEGKSQAAVEAAATTHQTARALGGELKVLETSLHFAGRAAAERPTTYVFYDKLFASVPLDSDTRQRLVRAADLFARAGSLARRNGDLWAEGFNAQWEARALLGLGQTQDARERQDHWLGLVGAEDGAAEAKLDQARFILVGRDQNWRRELGEAKEIVDACINAFKQWRYVAGLAEAATLDVYIELLREHRYRSDAGHRERAVDLCLAAVALHPYPTHPIYLTAQRLLPYFVQEMGWREYQNYEQTLVARVEERAGGFDLVRYGFAAPESTERLLPLLRSARHRK